MEKIVVSRYMGLVQFLRKLKLIEENTKVISFANPEDIIGKHVFGIMPYRLAALAGKFTEISIHIPKALRDTDLTVEQIELYALKPHTYEVKEVEFES